MVMGIGGLENRWRTWLAIAAGVLGIAEVIDAFFIEVPAVGIVFGLATAALGWWTWKSRSWIPVVLVLVLSALELLSVIFVYPNSADPPPAWRLAIFAVLSAIVVILAIVSLLRSRRAV